MRERVSWQLAAVFTACAVLLPVLAFLQYRWLGQLSATEYERMRRNLQQAADQLSEEFSGEFERIHTALQIGPAYNDPDLGREFEARFRAWTLASKYPRLVRAF